MFSFVANDKHCKIVDIKFLEGLGSLPDLQPTSINKIKEIKNIYFRYLVIFVKFNFRNFIVAVHLPVRFICFKPE